MGLEFREGHLNGVKVRAVGWQEQEPGSLFPKCLGCGFTFVSGKIVQNDDIAGLEEWSELGLDIGVKSHPVDWPIDNPGCHKARALQASDQGLGAPAAKGCLAVQARPFAATSSCAGHFRVGAGLVNEHQTLTVLSHDRLAARLPFGPCLDQIRPVLFACPKCFF